MRFHCPMSLPGAPGTELKTKSRWRWLHSAVRRRRTRSEHRTAYSSSWSSVRRFQPWIRELFTAEEESEGALPFLDTRLTHHDDGTLSTTVFRKNTDRYLNFESHHPLAHKAAEARTLLTRADRICTDFPDKSREKERVTQVLRMNGYPRELVTKNWKPTARPRRPEVSDTPKAKVILPYVRHLSKTIRRILPPWGSTPAFNLTTPSIGLWCTYKKIPHPCDSGQVWCIGYRAVAAKRCTSVKQGGHWTIV